MSFAHRPSSQGIRLDDTLSRVFFTPDGDMLDVLSDEDLGPNVTLSSTSSSEGRAYIPFVQYAAFGYNSDVMGGGGRSGHVGTFPRPGQGQTRHDFEDSAWRQLRWHRGIGECESV